MMRNKNSWTAVFALTLAGCGVGDPQTDLAADVPQRPEPRAEQLLMSRQALPVTRVPRESYRLAAQLLEDVRGTESAPTWGSAILASDVQPLYRPDVLGVAYYEFRVLVRERSMGFIIVSTGSHDYPIAHWNFEGLSPTETLSQTTGKAVTTFYKVDALSYVAEGLEGEMLANVGGLPHRIAGQDPAALDGPLTPTDVTWVPEVAIADDREASRAVARRVVDGPSTPTRPIELSGWRSWQDLKAGYRESYAPIAESLKRQAEEEWKTDALARDSGEGLVEGRSAELALLYPQAEFRLSGDGAQFVRSELVTTTAGNQKLVLTAFAAKPGVELPLTVDIYYPSAPAESVRFVVLAREDVSPAEASTSKSDGSESLHWADMGLLGAWSPWSTSFAGSHANQRLYGQMSSGTGPNTSGCYSGCGATAWSMLFGWGDLQASLGNPTWAQRWGMYRANGGYDADAVAPASMDTGVRNMTWEVLNHVDTFCNPFNDNGATLPADMDEANDYLKGRSGATVSTHYNVFGYHETRLREKARDSIKNRKVPAIIGTGWLTHYPLAYGYRFRSRTVKKCFILCWKDTEYQRQFYVNQGHSGYGNSWIGAGTWFAGELSPNN
jgi:hypothetical protein